MVVLDGAILTLWYHWPSAQEEESNLEQARRLRSYTMKGMGSLSLSLRLVATCESTTLVHSFFTGFCRECEHALVR